MQICCYIMWPIFAFDRNLSTEKLFHWRVISQFSFVVDWNHCIICDVHYSARHAAWLWKTTRINPLNRRSAFVSWEPSFMRGTSSNWSWTGLRNSCKPCRPSHNLIGELYMFICTHTYAHTHTDNYIVVIIVTELGNLYKHLETI